MIAWWWLLVVGALAYAGGRWVGRVRPPVLLPGDEMVQSVAACLEDPSEEWVVVAQSPTFNWSCAHNRVHHVSKPIVLIEDVRGQVQLVRPKCYLTGAQQRRLGRSIKVAKTFIVQRTTGDLPPARDLQQKVIEG